jgi:hypothetical protein
MKSRNHKEGVPNVRRHPQFVQRQIDAAYEIIDLNQENVSYAEGVRNALEWMLGDIDTPPIKEMPLK